ARWPLQAAAVALATHRAAEARALLAELDRSAAATWPARRLAAIAAEELGDRRAAIAALDGPGAPLGELAALARARDGQFAPLLRAALGRRSALVLDAAWSTTAHHNLDQPRIRNTLIGQPA